MKHKTHPKSMNVRLFTMFLACSLLLVGIPTITLAEAETEPIYFDFLSADDVTMEGGAKADDNSGTTLLLPDKDASVKLILPVKTNTNYTLYFKMKNSVKDALKMNRTENQFHYRSYKDRYMETPNSNDSNKPWGTKNDYFIAGGSFSYLIPGDISFGVVRTGDSVSFRDVSINFTTPKQNVEESFVTIKFLAAEEDDALAIKDLYLEMKKDNGTNRIFNGDFEALDATEDKLLPTSFSLLKYDIEPDNYELVEENNGNHYLRMVKSGQYHAAQQNGAFRIKKDESLPGEGKRFKLSMRVCVPSGDGNNPNNAKTGPRIGFIEAGKGLDVIGAQHFPAPVADKWETYTAYVDGSRYLVDGSHIWEKSLNYGFQAHTHYIDDLYLGVDETNIGFYKSLTYDENNRYLTIRKAEDTTENTDGIINTEKGDVATKIKDLADEAKDGFVKVTPRLHYIPTKNAGGTYDVQDISFIAAVYQKVGDKKILYSMDVATGKTTEGGKTIDIKIDDVKVPAEGGYYIEAMAWDGTNTMKPIKGVDKTIFN